MIQNYYTQAIKRYSLDVLREHYKKHESFIERQAAGIVSEKQAMEFISLLVDSFEQGYKRCLDDYKDKLHKMGYRIQFFDKDA